MFLSSGIAAVVIMGNSLAAKCLMSFGFRLKIASGDKKTKTDVLESSSFKNCHTAQLNEAEWAPIFIAGLLYLHSKGIAAPFASTASAVGCVWYFWMKAFMPFPSHVPGAVLRFISLTMLCWEVYKTL
mmetsp:Transcript_17168/g.25732  ORF Transcript_17168/g.25732 Transcript_17168/m.25732 type:complete len:128 (-) Transcript_17168:402-785(-)